MPKTIKFTIIFSAVIIFLLGLFYLNNNLKREATTIPPPSTFFQEKKAQLVEDFPEISIPPDTEVIDSYKKEEDGLVGFEANLETELSAYGAMSWYKNELTKNGWEIYDESVEEGAGELYIRASKEGRQVNILEDTEESQTIITIEFPYQ